MFFIMAGQVEVEILPNPVILETGQHFGEIALIRRTQRTATVLAVTECRLLALGVADFQRLLDVHPDIRERIAATAKERSEEHTSELQSLMRISYAVFCLKKKKNRKIHK